MKDTVENREMEMEEAAAASRGRTTSCDTYVAAAARIVNCGLDLRPEAVYTMLISRPVTMD